MVLRSVWGRVMSGGRICSENQEFMISVLICLFWS